MSQIPKENPYLYTLNKELPYYRELVPEPMFEAVWAKIKEMCVGLLSKLDPSHAEFFKENFPLINDLVDKPFFKESFKEMFAGCTDPQSISYQVQLRSVVAKMANYAKFCMERRIYKEEIDKVPIKKPIYIINLPRSGSTFTHRVLANDPKAKTIGLFQHINPGHRTMTRDARITMANLIIGQITTDGKETNQCHNMEDVTAPEEEIFFMEMLQHTIIYATSMPRWEQYRESLFKRDWDELYENILDEMRMAALEDGMKEDQYFLMKCVSHFVSLSPFFRIMCQDEFEPRIVWIHREPVDEFKSVFYMYLNLRARYKGDIGEDDIEWLQRSILTMHNIALKNAVYMREKWIEEKPERAKWIYDLGFKEMISDPVAATKKIYDYFGMEFKEGMEEDIKQTVENKHPQGKHGRKEKKDDDFLISDDEVRETFKWYYEKFPQHLPNYWGKKE